jgi:hypothetical protein
MQPLLEFPDNETESEKEEPKKKLLKIKKTLNSLSAMDGRDHPLKN